MAGGGVELVALRKRYGALEAVAGIDLAIVGGEFFSLLGPSGCGKTTTLRLVAGFERPDGGRIVLDGADVSFVPPHQRNLNTVFQSYALFPFLTVAENVAFGLRFKGIDKREAARRVGEALELVRLPGYERRRPNQLSGGQQQRVALARALVLRPAVLLLDEPLGALDASLRRSLQLELKSLQEEVGITFLYVTHDQEEALSMSDRVAVMNGGRLLQVGTATELYEEPCDAFVAEFLGVSNVLDGCVLRRVGGGWLVGTGDFELVASEVGAPPGLVATPGVAGPAAQPEAAAPATPAAPAWPAVPASPAVRPGPVKLVIRPERLRLHPYRSGVANCLPAMVERLVYLGSVTQVMLRAAPGSTLQALVTNDGTAIPWSQGSAVDVELPAEALRVLPAAAGSGGEGSGGSAATLRSKGSAGAQPTVVQMPETAARASSRLARSPRVSRR